MHKYLLLFSLLALSRSSQGQDCVLNPPYNLTVTGISPCSATLHWSSNSGGKFQVSYRLSGTTQWAQNIKVGLDTFYTFTGLQAGKEYELRVFSKCKDGSKSAFVKTTAMLPNCALPSSVDVIPETGNAFLVSVVADCPYDSLHVRFRTLSGSFETQSFAPPIRTS